MAFQPVNCATRSEASSVELRHILANLQMETTVSQAECDQLALITFCLRHCRLHQLYREIMGLPSPEAALQDHHTLLGGAALAVEVGDLVALVSPCWNCRF